MSAAVLQFPGRERQIVWQPQPGPQRLLLSCPIEDVFFGGARGGGKTDALLGDWLNHWYAYGKHARGALFRRNYPEMEEIEARSHEIFPAIGARWHGGKRTWFFPGGGRLKLRHLERDSDAGRYQGHAYTWIGVDEAGNFPSPDPIDKLRATLRSVHGVPCVMRLTGNPGGVGHNWLKARYIDPAPPLHVHMDAEAEVVRVFIPSKLSDNRLLLENDPGYVKRLKSSGPDWLVKAWMDGNWDIVAGGMFDDVFDRRVHLLTPFTIPRSWGVDRAFDWGSTKPYAVGWFAQSDGTEATLQNGRTFCPPRGSLILISELYGWTGKPNEGTQEMASEVAVQIKATEDVMRWGILREHKSVRPGPADSSIYNMEDGHSIADSMAKEKVHWIPANKKPGSRTNGWELMRQMMSAALNKKEEPHFYAFNTCLQFARTVPMLPRDVKRSDDVDTNAEDHIADMVRYRVLSGARAAKTTKTSGY